MKNTVSRIDAFFHTFRFILVVGFFGGVVLDLINFAADSYKTDIRLFGLLIFWIFILRGFRWQSDATFKLALGFLGLLFMYFIFARESVTTERVAVWIYFALIVGIAHQFLELRRKKHIQTEHSGV